MKCKLNMYCKEDNCCVYDGEECNSMCEFSCQTCFAEQYNEGMCGLTKDECIKDKCDFYMEGVSK